MSNTTTTTSPIPKMEQYSPLHTHNPVVPVPATSTAGKPKSKSKPRKRVNTAEKRHQHNAVERLRRETLNTKFIVLARLVPSLAKSGRPSKSAIVNGSITHMTKQRDQRLLAAKLLRTLCAERDQLAKECNEWRAASGFVAGKVAGGVTGWTEEMEEVCAVEKETFGEFANMGEEGEEEDGDADADESVETAAPTAPAGASADVSMGISMGLAMGIEAATAAVSAFDQRGLYTAARLAEVDPLATGFDLTNFGRPTTSSQSTNNRPLEISWPNGYPFTPALTSEPMSLSSNSLNTSSSTSTRNGSLPFSAFMSDSLESLSDSSPASLLGMPTPPTSSLLGMPTPPTSDPSRFTHTPSPGSSGSFEETNNKPRYPNLYSSSQNQGQNQGPGQGQWNQHQQQLLFLHSMQQQQLQSSQLAEIHHRSMSAATPASLSSSHGGFGRSQSADSGSSFPHNIHSSPLYPSNNFQHIQQQQQQIQMMLQQQQQQQLGSIPIPMGVGSASNQGQGPNQGMPRMSNEQLEAWRKIATGGNNGSGGLGGMWGQNSLKGY